MSKQQELDALAEFAGGIGLGYGLGEGWIFNGKDVICRPDWNPYTRPQDTWLVLEALVKHEQQRLSIMHGPQSWGGMGWDHVLCSLKSRVFHKWAEPFDPGEAVCSMALIIANSRKGESK